MEMYTHIPKSLLIIIIIKIIIIIVIVIIIIQAKIIQKHNIQRRQEVIRRN